MIQTKKIYLGLMFLAVFLVSLVPVFHIWSAVGASWKGIVPEYIEDSSYYYARINNVVRGHPFIGNPYFIEHAKSISPAFFVSDWLASAPFVLGIPFNISIVFNIIFWSEVFVFILYFLFKHFDCSDGESFIFSTLTYIQVFWLFVRPVAMQVVFPAYGLFLLTLFLWLKEKDNKKKILFVVLSSLYCVYIYTYLLQIVFFTFIIVFLQFLISKNWEALKKFIKILFIILAFSIPFLIISYIQISNPLYPETINRIGLLYTHIPRMEFYYYGRWVVAVIFLWFLSRKWIPSFKSEENNQIYNFILITGLGLLVASGSNIITGRELEISNHIGRFIIWWFGVTFFVYLSIFIKNYQSQISSLNLYKKICLFLIMLVCIGAMVRNIPRAFPFFKLNKANLVNIQNYGGPLNWLKENASQPSVVWADDRFSGYVPIYTKDYVLFHPSGVLQLVSDKELEDRYLVSKFLSGGLTRADIEREVGLYGGAGKALKGPYMQADFDYMYNRYQVDIKPNILKFLTDFKVQYIVIDLDNKTEMTKVKKFPVNEVYNDSHFVIYKLTTKAI